jgi:hypothetical protein
VPLDVPLVQIGERRQTGRCLLKALLRWFELLDLA